MARLLTVASLALVVALAAAEAARAQTADTEDDEARRLFDEGTAALTAGRLEEAVDALTRSIELRPRASAAYNLATALRTLGRPLEAATRLSALLSGAFGPLPDGMEPAATAALEAVRSEIGTVIVELRGAEDVTVRIGGATHQASADGLVRAEVDPGTVQIEARAPGFRPADRSVPVGAGELRRVVIELEAVGTVSDLDVAPPPAATPSSEEEPSLPVWPWIAIGAGVVVVAVAVVLAVVFLGSSSAEVDPVFGNSEVLVRF